MKNGKFMIAGLAATVVASQAAVVTVDYATEGLLIESEPYAAASYNNTLSAAGVSGHQADGDDISTYANIVRGGGTGQVVLGNTAALDEQTVIINSMATITQPVAVPYTDIFLGLNGSWGSSSVAPGARAILAQVGGTWYVSDEMDGDIGGGDTALSELDGFTVSDTVWHAWETDLTDGFNYAAIGSAAALPAGDITATGFLIVDDTGPFDASYTKEFAAVAIPEPATLGMLAAFGGGILFIRRRFMI